MLEFLLANHPLDCPVCDKGGECPLQDQAFSHGPGESRFVEEKRHYEKPIPISSLVYLDRERCILCDRCTRFATEVAGDPLISFTHRGNNTQVLTYPGRAVLLLLQREHRADLPGGRAHRQALPVPGPPVGPRADGEHLHHLLGRLPHHRPVQPEPAAPVPGGRQRPGELGLAVRQGPLRLRSRRLARTGSPPRWCREGDELVPTSWGRPSTPRRTPSASAIASGWSIVGGGARRCPRHQRGCVRVGPAGPRGDRHGQPRPAAG